MTISDLRIYFVGAQSTGKTTCARYVSERYHLPLLSEVVRGVLAKLETTLDRVRTDMDLNDHFQTLIFEQQVRQEKEQASSFVSDRAFDNIAYTAAHARNADAITERDDFGDYVGSLQVPNVLIFFVRPHPELLVADGTRSKRDLEWDQVVKIDSMIEFVLEFYGLRYFPVASLSLRDRMRLIDGVLSLCEK